VLGAVRIMQPVHGYDVRRELLTWRLEAWTNVKPGSVYSALKTLEKDGLIAVAVAGPAGPDPGAASSRPERTSYVLTGEGEKEFQVLLRGAWWRVERAAEPLVPALSLMFAMPRAELAAALQSRLGQLEGKLAELRFLRASIRDGATGADGEIPEHVREILDFGTARTRGELDWSKSLLRRLRAGRYVFADEPGGFQLGPGKGVQAALKQSRLYSQT
jgi:DNA-binding PadR family transcriptional regulator